MRVHSAHLNGWGGYCNTDRSGHSRDYKNGDKQKDRGGCQSDSNNNISQAWGAYSNSNNKNSVAWGGDNSSNNNRYSAWGGGSPTNITNFTGKKKGNCPSGGTNKPLSNGWERINKNEGIEKLTEEKNSIVRSL